MSNEFQPTRNYYKNIAESHLSIYSKIEIGDPHLWIPTSDLQTLLEHRLRGLSLRGLALRTRSKVVKQEICHALGYPVPSLFKRTRPRFPGQVFDIYIQKANNLQIWNEEIALSRRYVIIRVSSDDIIERVRVVSGDVLASLDTTGTLTQKYQARLTTGAEKTELIVSKDTENVLKLLSTSNHPTSFNNSPIDYPTPCKMLPIEVIYQRIITLVGSQFPDAGYDQERNRGARLHRLVCKALGFKDYRDDGRFPDIRNQLVEVKLQTSPTIDLGLVCPDSEEILDIPRIKGKQIRHRDVRYVLFYASTDGMKVTLTHAYVATGEIFFSRFPRFEGKVINKKIQLMLPNDFFAL